MSRDDDERREIAERLRKARVYTIVGKRSDGVMLEWHVALMSELAEAVGLKNAVGIEVLARLADLIEPDECQFRDATKTVDRDALLALADEIHGLVENQEIRFFHVVQVHESTLATIEARIRKALGVDDKA